MVVAGRGERSTGLVRGMRSSSVCQFYCNPEGRSYDLQALPMDGSRLEGVRDGEINLIFDGGYCVIIGEKKWMDGEGALSVAKNFRIFSFAVSFTSFLLP